MSQPTDLEKFLFDLNGYILVEDALSAVEVAELNSGINSLLPITPGQWDGYIHCRGESANNFQLQQIYEAGKPFERLIDHPAWFEKLKCFVGGEGTFDFHHGPLFIDEAFSIVRDSGEATRMHSGGYDGVKRTQYRFHNGRFQCGQVNMLLALTDMMPGDGATMAIPGSHKSNFPHPQLEGKKIREVGSSMEDVAGAVEINIKAGSAILFVDAISHGSARRTNPGQRRVVIYRYGPSWGNHRYGYQPSPALLRRLTPQRRNIVKPLELLDREPQIQR